MYKENKLYRSRVSTFSFWKKYHFGRSNTTEEYPTAAEFFNSLSRKLNDLFRMSDNESLDNARNTSGNIAGNGNGGHSQQDPPARAGSPILQPLALLVARRGVNVLTFTKQEVPAPNSTSEYNVPGRHIEVVSTALTVLKPDICFSERFQLPDFTLVGGVLLLLLLLLSAFVPFEVDGS
uniref:Uncharacterized protein n=1 Tax=Glossina palpalis gambiensis TaxID=67801 RepID=A0A1B0C021_9MUSC